MIRSSISSFLLLVGLIWSAVVSWLFVALGGTANLNPAYIGKALLWYSWLFVGPLLLISGAILMLMGSHQKAGSILSLVGCVILTVMVGYQTLSMLHDASDPLVIRPQYSLYAVAVILTLLADVGAVKIYRLIALAVDR